MNTDIQLPIRLYSSSLESGIGKEAKVWEVDHG